jgi:Cd2+/Zn2+-exporting ATPase
MDGRWDEAQAEVLYWAAAAESGSGHPLARAVTSAAEAHFGRLETAAWSETLPGRGVQADLHGRIVRVGAPAWLGEHGVWLDERAQAALKQLKEAGKTTVVVSLDDQAIGILGIADRMRLNAPEMLRQLKAAGVGKLVMLTGDDAQTAHVIAQESGLVEFRAGLLPEDKLDEIRSLQAQGYRVAMIGDGINDAPALAAADISMAMKRPGRMWPSRPPTSP